MKNIVLGIFLAICQLTFSQQFDGMVMDENGQPIVGASALIKGSDKGAITNNEGWFSIQRIQENDTLIISAFSFETDTIILGKDAKMRHITLKTGIELSDLVVTTGTQGAAYNRKSISNLQHITGGELRKAACCNLSESFETNASVDVAYSDAATGAKQIKLLGLAGTYVQMLSENVPTLRGISSPYGLGYTPGPWMESIQISKGAASVKNGYESITGQINVEYLKPDKGDRLGINVYGNDAGRTEANLNASIPLNKHLSTGLLMHIDKDFVEIDDNNDGFMDMPMVQQQNILNRWKYENDDYDMNTIIRFINEKRNGGQINEINNPYLISIDNKRYEFFSKNGYMFDDKNFSSIALIASASLQENYSKFGEKQYNGTQTNWYANLIFETEPSKEHKLATGASFNYDKYLEKLNFTPLNSEEFTPGIFAEYTFNHKDKLIAMVGLRGDYSTRYGIFYTPRIHVKYNPSKRFNIRSSIGKGYRSPNILAENSFLLASSRNLQIASNLKQEEAWNYGFTATGYLHINKRELTIQGEYFHTSFVNQAISDIDSNPHSVNIINVHNGSFANSYQLEASYEIIKRWNITIAHRITDTKQTINGVLREKPLTNRSKSLITTSYQTKLKKWQFDFTSQFNGGGRMPDPDPINPTWKTEFDPYTILNAQITKFYRNWSVYVGAENILNFRQKNPIIDAVNPTGSNFDASMIWGPIDGRKIYIGLRWSLAKKETNL
jgi:outer membrane receptor for ferrienterochelin and colicins